MTWFKVDDKLHDHRKTRTAGTEAMGLWVLAGSWSADNLTDGFVPASLLGRWGRNAGRYAVALVDAGYWVAHEKDGEPGWLFLNWERWQPTKAKVEASRAAARERMNKNRSSREQARNFRRSSLPPSRPDPPEGGGSVVGVTSRDSGEPHDEAVFLSGTGWVPASLDVDTERDDELNLAGVNGAKNALHHRAAGDS